MTDVEGHVKLRTGTTLRVGAVTTVDGVTRQLRPAARRATVLVLPHADDCEGCRRYLRDIADGRDRLSRWQADVVAVLGSEDAAGSLDLPAVADEDGDVRDRIGIPHGIAAAVVADRHGEVWELTTDPGGHELPSLETLAQDVRFIAIQCPECEVPDTPDMGEWGPR